MAKPRIETIPGYVDEPIQYGADGKLSTYRMRNGITVVALSDEPLPKTPLRKVARGRLRDEYVFDFQRWLQSEDEGA